MSTEHICVVRACLFSYVVRTGQYKDLGTVGCTIIATTSEEPVVILGCYNNSNEYICTADIKPTNEAGADIALHDSYISFKDTHGKNWFLQFELPEMAAEFCAHVVVGMYGSARQPEESLLVCDIAKGTGERLIFAGDSVKVRYACWVVQHDSPKSFPKLGSKLEATQQKPFVVVVPPNHSSLTEDMKGFEGMVIGMRQGGCRVIVVPKGIKRGSGPQVSMCFLVEAVRIKRGSGHQQGTASPVIAAPTNHATGQAYASLVSPQSVPGTVPGFSGEQFCAVDRLRDHVFSLMEQLREARQQLQSFRDEFKAQERAAAPKSLSSAQVEFSVHTLFLDLDSGKRLLIQKESTIAQLEEKNQSLQERADKLASAAASLAEAKRSSALSQSEEKLDLDRQQLQAQTHLNRLHAELDDSLKHLRSLKRLIETAQEEITREKGYLNVSLVSFQANESKLAVLEDQHREENERCRLLESKNASATEELRGFHETMENIDAQLDAAKRRVEGDNLHYSQLLQEERRQACEELAEVRQEFLKESTEMERRYQEERQRVLREAFERGRLQGIEDGQAEAFSEADLLAQEVTLNIQRHKAEIDALQVRISTAKEEKLKDEKRFGAELAATQKGLDTLHAEIDRLTGELDLHKRERDDLIEKMYRKLEGSLEAAREPLNRNMLLQLADSLEFQTGFDYLYLIQKEKAIEQQELQREKANVVSWVRATLYNQHIPFPSMKPLLSASALTPPTSSVISTLVRFHETLKLQQPLFTN